MIEQNPMIDAAVEAVLKAADLLQRGDVLTIEAIERVGGIDRYTLFWSSLIRKLKREMLRHRGIALWDVRGIPELWGLDVNGYALCTHEQQLNLVADKRQRRAKRQLRRARNEVGALPEHELTTHQRTVQWFRLQQLRAQENRLAASRRQQERKASEALPVKPRL